MKSLSRVASTLPALFPLLLCAEEAPISQLPTATVTGHSTDTHQDSLDSTLQRIAEIPGAASVSTPDDWTGRALAPEELFQFTPSVYARSRGVGNDTRISVRGSGLQRAFGDRGLTLLLDGAPINHADGSFYYRAVDPFSIHHIETFPGANGLSYGATQLGGAINIVQKNGLNSAGTHAQIEAGRHDTFRAHLSHGGSNERWDWYAGYSYAESDGYRERQQWDSYHLNANLGYHWSDTAVTRFYFHSSDSDAALVGSLTEQQLRDNPRSAGPPRPRDVDRDLTTIRLGQKTEWKTVSGAWSFYTNYQYLDFDHLINRDSRFGFNRFIDYDSDDYQIGLRGHEDFTALGLEHTIRVSANASLGRQQENGFTTLFGGGPPRTVPIDRINSASNAQIYIENDTIFSDSHHLILGVGFVGTRRDVDLNSGDQTRDVSQELTEEGLTYRLGYLYDPSESFQLFANYSQSFEGSPFAEASEQLDPQFARTFEIGTRFTHGWASGQVAFYRSDVADEFIDEEIAPGVSSTTNFDSIHQGVEAAVTFDLSQLANWQSGPALFLDHSYQWNDFTIEEGLNKGNALPGVSEHVYSGRLRAEDRSGKWKLGLSAEWLPEGFIADNANTLETKGFINWRISGEVMIHEGVRLYGGIDNLFDATFTNAVVVNPSSDAFINPGNGQAAYVGLKFAW